MKLAATVVFLMMPAVSMAQQIAVGAYFADAIGEGFYPAIAAGPDGALWFTDWNTNQIRRITTAGAITGFPVPESSSGNGSLWGIVAGPDGALWFTEHSANRIGRITTAGAVSQYPLRSPGGAPYGITAGPDGALWFAESAYEIGRITTAGAITEYPSFGGSSSIVAGPDGALWFTGLTSIGRITTGGVLTEYPVPGARFLYGITAGPDGALWFTDSFASTIGRITTTGTITVFPLPTGAGQEYGEPEGITTGPDGALWFAQLQWTNIGRVTTAGEFSFYPTPTNAGSAPWSIVTGPDGELWMGASGGGMVEEAVFVTASLSVSPPTGNFGSALAFTGSGFAPGESVRIYVSGVGSAVLASATANSSGGFTATARSPQSVYGSRIFLGVGQSSGNLGAASFSMAPHVSIDPESGAPGSNVVVEGSGFGPLESIGVTWNGTSLGSATADVHGTFNGSAAFAFTVPEGTSPGKYAVSATGSKTGANSFAYFSVQ
jgi:virginiamycin B lyase